MAHVLIVEDEDKLCGLLITLLRDRGHSAQGVASGEAALAAARKRRPDLVLLDLHLGGIDGMETLRRLRSCVPGCPVVMMTAVGSVADAVNAMKLGAIDFVTRPFKNGTLLDTLDKLLVMQRRACCESSPALIGESTSFRSAVDMALRFAVPDVNVLLFGETGTGKELFARIIHGASKRRNEPFVAVDCSMLAENLIESELFGHEKGAFTGATAPRVGRFELAQGGTLFLDEIGNFPVAFQAKLLRVLQERQMERVGGQETIRLDVRVLSASNVNLKDAIHAGTFRRDLYYRLNEMNIELPPLRERTGDISSLAQHFVELYARCFGTGVKGLSDAALDLLNHYRWPGNVRELENAIKSAVVLADDLVRPEHLPPEVRDNGTPAAVVCTSPSPVSDGEWLRIEMDFGLRAFETDLKALGIEVTEKAERSLLAALVNRSWLSSTQLARKLGVDPKTLRTKLRKYGLEIGVSGEDTRKTCTLAEDD